MTSVSPPPSLPVVGGGTAGATTTASPDRATVDLLGVLAYGELSAFDRLAEDARLHRPGRQPILGREAIRAANLDQSVDGCPAGAGAGGC